MKLKLTKSNYFTKKNTYISSSKLSTFLKDKYLYKRKYIDWEPQEKTDSLIIGSAVDTLLTGTLAKYNKEFVLVDRRSSKETADKRTQITATMWDKINGIILSVQRQSIWADLKQKKWKKQTILADDTLGICGMLDFLTVNGDHAIIVDLKTSNTIDPKKYYYHCWDYNYFMQAAFYTTLVKANYPEVRRVDFYHFAVEKDADELYNCALFQFDKDIIAHEVDRMKAGLLQLRQEKEFKPLDVGWKDKIIISNLLP